MKIYSLLLSEDGLNHDVYTNVKAMFNGIEKLGDGYMPTIISMYDRKANEGKGARLELKYSYANLVKAIRISTTEGKYYAHLDLECDNEANITVTEHRIVSK
jgi:hypothetical protein